MFHTPQRQTDNFPGFALLPVAPRCWRQRAAQQHQLAQVALQAIVPNDISVQQLAQKEVFPQKSSILFRIQNILLTAPRISPLGSRSTPADLCVTNPKGAGEQMAMDCYAAGEIVIRQEQRATSSTDLPQMRMLQCPAVDPRA